MGKRGPAPKPLELKVLEGDRGHRPLNLDAVFRPEVGVPDMPRWLLPEARKAWRRLSDELVKYNLLARTDQDAFAMLCQTVGRLEQVERAIAGKQKLLVAAGQDPTDALFDETPNKLKIQSVLYQVLNKEQAKLHKLLESFGLRPDARAGVSTAIRAQLQLFEGGAGNKPDTPPTEPRGFADF